MSGNDVIEGGAGADTFVFQVGLGSDTVIDFQSSESDLIRLDDALWGSTLGVTVADVLSSFGEDNSGTVILNFGANGMITLDGLTTLTGLDAFIDIF
jgi:Ca2+-binding RTX toxin-like protein